MKKTKQMITAVLLMATAFSACKKDKQEQAPKASPTIDNIEVGLNNNEVGVIGRDFHLNAEVLAGDKIEKVVVKIQQRSDASYEKEWSFEIAWDQYQGAKNATVHKHFHIPAEAVEGKYDFLIIVHDQNGTKLEVKRSITIYDAANLPVDPELAIFSLMTSDGFFYRNGKFTENGAKLKKGETLASQVTINNIKGDGKLYVLLIPKKNNHRPESISAIDFNKAIVYDVYEHNDWATSSSFSNSVFDAATFTSVRDLPSLLIGAEKDNHASAPKAIDGLKAWASGAYYFGFIYENTTYNTSIFNYIEFGIDY